MEKINFTDRETGETDSFYVLEKTVVGGSTYLLVTEEETEDSEAYILKMISAEESEEAVYEIVDDDASLEALSKIFVALLDDTDIVS